MRDATEPASDAAWERLLEVKRDGGMCAACGRALDVGEPVWRRRVVPRRDWTSYFSEVNGWAFVGRECATPELLRKTERREPVTCAGCGRSMHIAAAPGPRQRICSFRCRSTAQRRRATGG